MAIAGGRARKWADEQRMRWRGSNFLLTFRFQLSLASQLRRAAERSRNSRNSF